MRQWRPPRREPRLIRIRSRLLRHHPEYTLRLFRVSCPPPGVTSCIVSRKELDQSLITGRVDMRCRRAVRVRVLVGGRRKYRGEVEANLGRTHRILQAAECSRRSASKPAEHWAEQEAADRSAQGCHYGDDRNRHQSRNECVFDCRDARLVASKFLNR